MTANCLPFLTLFSNESSPIITQFVIVLFYAVKSLFVINVTMCVWCTVNERVEDRCSERKSVCEGGRTERRNAAGDIHCTQWRRTLIQLIAECSSCVKNFLSRLTRAIWYRSVNHKQSMSCWLCYSAWFHGSFFSETHVSHQCCNIERLDLSFVSASGASATDHFSPSSLSFAAAVIWSCLQGSPSSLKVLKFSTFKFKALKILKNDDGA